MERVHNDQSPIPNLDIEGLHFNEDSRITMDDLLKNAQENSPNASTMWIFLCCWNRTIDSRPDSAFLGRNLNTGNIDLFKPGIHFLPA